MFRLQSLKTKVTIFTVAIFLIGIWSLAFYATRLLREDMQRLFGDQQYSTVSLVAAQVDQELADRLKALEKVAESVSPAMMADTATVQALLEQRPLFQSLFNGGTFVTRLDGVAIASIPLLAGRFGGNYLERDFMIAALKEGKTSIGKPFMDGKSAVPTLVMAAPIRDIQGRVIGALAGVTNLGNTSFLDKLTEHSFGKSGGYLLAAPQHQLFVTGTDKSRILQRLPAPGVNSMHDRYMKGFDGFGTAVNSRGIEELSAAKRVPVAGWFVIAVLPTGEAFAPIGAMQRRMLTATILLTLLVGGLTWWLSYRMLNKQLSPILAAAKTLVIQSDTDQIPQPLPIARQDEIGELIGAFNTLLETLGERETTLRASEKALQDKNSELERFTYTVSHDLKSPLITIQAFAGMISKDLESGKYARAQGDLKRIEDAAVNMTLLLNDLLELSRVGRIMDLPIKIDMNILVKNVLAQLTGPIDSRRIEVVVQPDLPSITGDMRRLSAVLQNLIENAVKYMGEQAAPRIEIGARLDGEELQYFVRDNGKGVEPRFQENIFGLFNKLDPESEGTGIGLSLVRRIIEVHGGRVWVESDGEGHGACFCFTVPEERNPDEN